MNKQAGYAYIALKSENCKHNIMNNNLKPSGRKKAVLTN